MFSRFRKNSRQSTCPASSCSQRHSRRNREASHKRKRKMTDLMKSRLKHTFNRLHELENLGALISTQNPADIQRMSEAVRWLGRKTKCIKSYDLCPLASFLVDLWKLPRQRIMACGLQKMDLGKVICVGSGVSSTLNKKNNATSHERALGSFAKSTNKSLHDQNQTQYVCMAVCRN